jgi:hypothetical protein
MDHIEDALMATLMEPAALWGSSHRCLSPIGDRLWSCDEAIPIKVGPSGWYATISVAKRGGFAMKRVILYHQPG